MRVCSLFIYYIFFFLSYQSSPAEDFTPRRVRGEGLEVIQLLQL